MSHNFETFSTPHEGLFLVFGVPNAKYLAFDTPDENALTIGEYKYIDVRMVQREPFTRT